MDLRNYQNDLVNNIYSKLRDHRKVLAQLSTGGGKSHVFAHIIKDGDKVDKRTLVLVHRQELVGQTQKILVKLGVTSEVVLSKTRKIKNRSNCVIAMVETAYNRLEKDSFFFANIDLVIADEAHIQVFDKVFDFFPNSKILGFTATPVILSRQTFFRCHICRMEYQENTECCGGETMEYTRPNSLSQKYDDIAVGIGIDKLIERGNLVKEISLVKKSVDTSSLKVDGTGEYTEKSQNHAFRAKASVSSLVDDYVQFCEGKKTMIFTGSTKVNKLLLKAFEGRNVKLLDTVNSTDKRTEVVDWFKSERDAIIISTGILTAGFDCTDVEAIMLYRATQSLALYVQIVGRGARTTKKIYKDNFLFIDYGDNIQRFGEFSDPNRDWEDIFFNGIGEERAKRVVLESVDQCDECGVLYPASFPACPHCGNIQPPKKAVEKIGKEYVIRPIAKMPPPSGNKILEYTKEMGKDAEFAFKVLSNQMLDLFRFYMVDKDLYYKARTTGEVEKKVKKMVTPCYFVFIKSDLEDGNRRLGSILKLILNKLDGYYKY